MPTAIEAYQVPGATRSRGVWVTAWKRLKNDHVGAVSLWIVAVFIVMILLSSLGLLAGDPVCLHRAAYWYALGVLERGPEPQPPAAGDPAPRADTLALPAALAA